MLTRVTPSSVTSPQVHSALSFHSNGDAQCLIPYTASLIQEFVRKAPGPDGLMAEHLKAGGEAVVIWLLRILNAIKELEVVLDVLKRGLIVPVYKGGGKDPLKVDSYRGVTLTSVVAKVLEFLVLERLQPVFMEAGLPHVNQSGYRKAV